MIRHDFRVALWYCNNSFRIWIIYTHRNLVKKKLEPKIFELDIFQVEILETKIDTFYKNIFLFLEKFRVTDMTHND